MRLWDLRKMRSNLDFETFENKNYSQSSYDYRLAPFVFVSLWSRLSSFNCQAWILRQAEACGPSKRL